MRRSREPKAPRRRRRLRRRRWPQSGQWEGSETRVPEWGTVAGSPDRRAAEAAMHSPFQPEGEKLWKGETERESGVSVGPSGRREGALRKSRWERGTYERVARGGVRPTAGAGGYPTRIENGPFRGRARGCGVLSAVGYITRSADGHELPVGSSLECEGCGHRAGRI
jgi:hypothetical protein